MSKRPLACRRAMLICAVRNYEEAIRLMQRATTVPKNTKINYYDDVSRFLFSA